MGSAKQPEGVGGAEKLARLAIEPLREFSHKCGVKIPFDFFAPWSLVEAQITCVCPRSLTAVLSNQMKSPMI
jgi:hypothetical protein